MRVWRRSSRSDRGPRPLRSSRSDRGPRPLRSSRSDRGPRPWLAAVAAALTLACAHATDVIFRVPEVLVRHAAVPRAVGTGRANVTSATARAAPAAAAVARPNDSDKWGASDSARDGGGKDGGRYEEYFVEHDISTADARNAARQLNLDSVPVTRPGCGVCTRRELDYCETRMLADHCCCELRFFPEPFPWLPHTCYMGPDRCKPLAHDCARYARLRDCCCYKKLAERWKSILSASTRPDTGMGGLSLLLVSMLLFVAYL